MKVHCKASAKALGVKLSKDAPETTVHPFSNDRALVVFPAYEPEDGGLVPAYATVVRLADVVEYVTRIEEERAKKPATWSA